VDDARAKLQLQVAERQHASARLQAGNDVDVRYSKAAEAVAKAEYEAAVQLNVNSPGAISASEVRRLLLAAQRATLGIEQAELDHKSAAETEKLRTAELEGARYDIERRRVLAPVAGEVVEIFKRVGEWVQTGDPVVRIVRMDRLRVEGFADAAQTGDEEIVDGLVEVTVRRQRDEPPETFTGKIVYVNPIIEATGSYRVWAEVENRQRNGRWLLRPGMEAHMKIHPGKTEQVSTARARKG
jgi:multidrug efflux pump subunit AcrA (membrane-fusion protein)